MCLKYLKLNWFQFCKGKIMLVLLLLFTMLLFTDAKYQV